MASNNYTFRSDETKAPEKWRDWSCERPDYTTVAEAVQAKRFKDEADILAKANRQEHVPIAKAIRDFQASNEATPENRSKLTALVQGWTTDRVRTRKAGAGDGKVSETALVNRAKARVNQAVDAGERVTADTIGFDKAAEMSPRHLAFMAHTFPRQYALWDVARGGTGALPEKPKAPAKATANADGSINTPTPSGDANVAPKGASGKAAPGETRKPGDKGRKQ